MTKVIFRKFKSDGAVVALFPDEPYDNHSNMIMSYMHVGQHGGADYYPDGTVPATPKEYAPLLKELKSIGYDDLIIRKRRNR